MPPGGPFLPLTGGTVSGPLNYTATGGTASRAAQDRAVEAISVKDFGAKGDGSDDGSAFAAALAHVASGGRLVVPAGSYNINQALSQAITGTVTFEGAGSGTTVLYFNAAADGLTFSLASNTVVHVSGLTLIRAATGATYANNGLSITSAAQALRYGVASVRDVAFIGSSHFWATGIYVFNVSNASLDHISYIAPNATGTGADGGTGIYLAGASGSSYLAEVKLNDINTQGGTAGLQIGDWVQGVYVTQSAFIGNNYGLVWSGVSGDADLWLAVSNSHFNSGTRGLFADVAMSPQITNTYVLHFGVPTLDSGNAWAAFEFHNLSPGLISNSTIYGAGSSSTSPQEYGVQLLGGSNCTVIGSFFNNVKTAGVYVNGTVNTIVTDNTATLPAGVPLVQYTAVVASNQAYNNLINGVPDGAGSGSGYTATGTTTSRSAQDRAAEVFNVMDYGAKGDGATDDTAAINAAIAACVYLVNAGWGGIVYFPAKKFRCNGSINLTGVGGFNVAPLVVDAWGAIIDSHATGKPAVDGTWGQCVNINGLTIRGDTTDKPTYGLQMARKDTTGVGNSADWRTNGLTLTGSFSQAAMICLASESAVHVALRINNADPSGDGLRMDGINHFNLTSAFQAITLPVNTSESFNDNIFVGAIIQTTNTTAGSPLWITGALGAQFDKSYFSTGGANSIVLFQKSGCNANYNLQLNVHSETSAIHDTILVTGDAGSVDLQGLRFEDYYIEATNSVFKLGGSVTSVAMGGCELRINDGAGGWTKVFDNPGAWTVTGNAVMQPGSTRWNLNSQFIGTVTTGSSQVYSYGNHIDVGNPYFAGTPWFAGTPYFANGLTSGGTVQAATLALGSDSQASALYLLLDTAAGQYRRITYRTAGLDVWSLYTDNSAQSGGNTGSNFQLDRYDDAGIYLGTPIIINRANGFMAVQSGLSVSGAAFLLPPPTVKTGTAYTLGAADYSLILNPSGAFVLTLPGAGGFNNGRTVVLKLIAAFAVTGGGSYIVPLAGGSPTNAILPATIGKWCILTSDGSNWQIMAAN